MHNEQWKDVVGYEEYYEVSNLGRVRRKKDVCFSNGSHLWHPEGVLKPLQFHRKDLKRSDYRRVCLCKNGEKPKQHRLHRVVAKAWIPNPLNKPEVNHKNGIKYDNRVENLEWMTGEENRAHQVANGLAGGVKGVRSVKRIA